MANQEHLDILKQGVELWNTWWRKEYSDIGPDLSRADLSEANLNGIYLYGAKLNEARLSFASLTGAFLYDADLSGADLSGTNLNRADLSNAKLHLTNLSEADLIETVLLDTDFTSANLSNANITYANLTRVNLSAANLKEARIGFTQFVDIDLSTTQGLDYVVHYFPSTIGIDTIYRSQGKIPESFLRRAGVPGSFIEYMHSLLGKPIDYYSCFISYSSKDQDFADRLYADLQSKGVRCWFAPEDMKIGDKIRPRLDEAIRLHDKLLLVLSEQAVKSAWVEKEVETAFEKEHLHNKPVLFPIRLDGAVMQTTQAWAADIRRTRHIGNFTQWKNHDMYHKAFSRLLRDLKQERD